MRVFPMNIPAPLAAMVGTTGLSFPLWSDMLTRGHEIAIATGGVMVLFLTIRGKLLDNAIKRRQLRALRDSDGGST
ncbi:hypothetical protein [Poseidonocella sp. HB161398]|uniref:hypothetical protein n=1 Tax=Poseidonocella sp. HB161398 TaxID=2320855 RepID=UPI0011092B21|nr:hypothetical protein [Poseidonocella sp. HB161398]